MHLIGIIYNTDSISKPSVRRADTSGGRRRTQRTDTALVGKVQASFTHNSVTVLTTVVHISSHTKQIWKECTLLLHCEHSQEIQQCFKYPHTTNRNSTGGRSARFPHTETVYNHVPSCASTITQGTDTALV